MISQNLKKNSRERRLPFEQMVEFEWETAIASEDVRTIYPERRFVAIGYLGIKEIRRLHVVCFTPIEAGIRIISLRKANLRERRYYEKKIINS